MTKQADDAPQPNWQPISQLPLLTEMVDGVIENSEEQYATFTEVRKKLHVFDDEIVDRAIRLYQNQLMDCWFYEEQFRRWQALSLTESQCQTVDRLASQVPRIRELSEKNVTLLHEIRKGTINRIMEMDDLQLGLEVLMGKRRR